MEDSLSLTIAFIEKDLYFPIVLESTETIENLKVLIEVQSSIPVSQQILKFNGKILLDNSTLITYNIANNDMIQMIQLPPFNPSKPLDGLDIMNIEAEELQQIMKNYHPLWQFVQNKADLLAAVVHPDGSVMDKYLAQIQKRIPKFYENPHPPLTFQQIEMRRRIFNNPNDLEAKKFLEEEERKKQVQENLLNAIEYTPEAFGNVVMLYIDCEVNDVPLKAFIDSGAQKSVMSKKCAIECGLINLLDTNFKGIAKGVGSANILGKIHLAQLKIGKSFFNLSVIVIDQNDMDFLLGLDFLKAHQCSIDLKDNVLRIGQELAKFLSEGEISKNAIFGGEITPTSPKFFNPFENSRIQTVPPSEENINILVGMGALRNQAIDALKQTNNNLNLAANLIFR